jgi:hypothetical protein
MKKLLITIIIAAILIVLPSCVDDKEDKPNPSETSSQNETSNPTTSDSAKANDDKEDNPNPSETSSQNETPNPTTSHDVETNNDSDISNDSYLGDKTGDKNEARIEVNGDLDQYPDGIYSYRAVE